MNGVHCLRRSQPADGYFMAEKPTEQEVSRPPWTLQEKSPGLSDDHRANEQRDDQDRHDQTATLETSGHDQRQSEAQKEFDGDVGERKDCGHDQRPTGVPIEDDLAEILEPDEGVAGNGEIVVDEGNPDREQQRID